MTVEKIIGGSSSSLTAACRGAETTAVPRSSDLRQQYSLSTSYQRLCGYSGIHDEQRWCLLRMVESELCMVKLRFERRRAG